MSAGLQSVGTCLQCDDGMRLTVPITLLQTLVLSLAGEVDSQHKTIVESLHAYTSARGIDSALEAVISNLLNN